jgi:hypothetical protein
MRVARWQRRGWESKVAPAYPVALAEELLDDAVPLLTGDPKTTAQQYVQGSAEELKALQELTDRELLVKAARNLLIVCILICEGMVPHIPSILRQRKMGIDLAHLEIGEATTIEGVIVRVESRQWRFMESTRENGEKLISDGRATQGARQESPWLKKCG